jgi:hypothetical protein
MPRSVFGTLFALIAPVRTKAVLKITILENRTRRRLVLEGNLVAPWTTELRNAYERARTDLSDRELVIEIRYLTAISQEGEHLLLEFMNENVKFRSYGVFTKHVLSQLARRRRGNRQEAAL